MFEEGRKSAQHHRSCLCRGFWSASLRLDSACSLHPNPRPPPPRPPDPNSFYRRAPCRTTEIHLLRSFFISLRLVAMKLLSLLLALVATCDAFVPTSSRLSHSVAAPRAQVSTGPQHSPRRRRAPRLLQLPAALCPLCSASMRAGTRRWRARARRARAVRTLPPARRSAREGIGWQHLPSSSPASCAAISAASTVGSR